MNKAFLQVGRWLFVIFVSAKAILGGLMGTFLGFQSVSQAITITLAGVLFMAWLLSPRVRNWRHVESA
jgi:hypothetical protein